MVVFSESAQSLKVYLAQCKVKERALMMFNAVGASVHVASSRMSCSSASSVFVHKRLIEARSRVSWHKFVGVNTTSTTRWSVLC